ILADSIKGPSNKDTTRVKYLRIYPYAQATSHIIGYRQLADQKALDADTCNTPLTLNDKIGKNGIEGLFDCILRGSSGKRLLETDSKGSVKKILAIINPKKGTNITTSLDGDLQKSINETIVNNDIVTNQAINLDEQKIAVIATKPQTGEILALYSHPTFDPNAFENQDVKALRSYFSNKSNPLFNRAVSGTYPPGSVIKPMIAAAALEENAIDKDTEIEDTGQIQAGKQLFGNWFFLQYGKKDGMVNVVKSLQRSNDIFYYTVGAKLRIENIKKWAYIFGYGKKTGIGLSEAEGVIPSAFWKETTLHERWYLGDTYNLSIGQGYLLTTPLQVHFANEPFANKGYACKPMLYKVDSTHLPSCKKLPVKDTTLDLVREGMRKACETGGTGWPFFNWKLPNGQIIPVGCKTGTAESKHKGHPPHAWFTIFAPFDNPEIHITIMVEESGEGSNVAAPIAKTILTKYFTR
ncbi:MAG: penicillin-binding transpeptidase domain-containing protein, partial [Candidatus Roizmanbacteria bacterium]